jgi:hypothetical protein
VAETSAPALQILFFSFSDTENLPKSIRADADRHQHRDVLDLSAPAPLEDHSIEV